MGAIAEATQRKEKTVDIGVVTDAVDSNSAKAQGESSLLARIAALENALANALQELTAAQEKSHILEQKNQSLHLSMDEVQMKLKSFVSRADEMGDPKIRRLIESTGFTEMINMKGKTVW